MQYATVVGDEWHLRVEVGYLEAEEPERRIFQFGLSTEVFVSSEVYGQEHAEVKVIRSSVNAGTEHARQALETFEKAIEIAEAIEMLSDHPLVEIGYALLTQDAQTDLNFRIVEDRSRVESREEV